MSISFLFVSLFVLCCNTMLGNGQCTTSSCKDSISGSEENLLERCEEREHKMAIMHQKLSSDVNRSIVRGQEELEQNVKMAFLNLSSKIETIEERYRVSDQRLARELEEHDQNLKSTFHNMSLKFENIYERIEERNESRRVEEIEQKLRTISDYGCLSRTKTIDESIRSVNESLARSLTEHDQNMRSVYQNVSSRWENNEKAISALQATATRLSNKANDHEQTLEIMNQNLSYRVKTIDESIQSVNESLTRNLNEHDHNLKLLNQSISSKFDEVHESLSSVSSKLQMMNESVVIALKEELDRKFQSILETISLSIIKKFNAKLNGVLNQVNESLRYNKSQDYCQDNASICDCSTIRDNGNTTSGVYRIYVDHRNVRHYANASCDMTTGNVGWTVFQRRKDGSEDFYRGWNDYANGFGNPNGEYWLGNNFLHFLTSKRRYRLRIDLEDFDGGKRFAEYSTFNISSAADKYRLRIGTYSGNAGDSLAWHNNRQFSTKDQDNDAYRANCAVRDRGAWWYGYCHHSNLNGFYYRSGSYSCSGCVGGDGIVWGHWKSQRYSLKSTEMKISFY